MIKKKSNNALYRLRMCVACFVFVLTILAFAGVSPVLYKFLYLQLGPQLAKSLSFFSILTIAMIISILLLTFLFGRFYCSTICPFGFLQELIDKAFGRKLGKCKNFYKTRYVIALMVFGLLIGGSVMGLRILDPYTNFGLVFSNILDHSSILSLSHAIFVVLIITILVSIKNRIFCTTICPVGTILGLCAKHGVYKLNINSDCVQCGICEKECPAGCIDSKNIDNERCIRCLKCITNCSKQAIEYDKIKKEEIKFDLTRRNFVIGFAFLGVALASIKAGLVLANEALPRLKKRTICPPGAGTYEKFKSKCTSCNLCVTNCRGKVLKKADFENDTVHLDFNSGKCKYDCTLCNEICPMGALKEMTLTEKQHCQIGIARLNASKCISCERCLEECPAGAITKQDSNSSFLPQVNPHLCVGCGACENICPTKAILVSALDKQTIIDI